MSNCYANKKNYLIYSKHKQKMKSFVKNKIIMKVDGIIFSKVTENTKGTKEKKRCFWRTFAILVNQLLVCEFYQI